MTTRHRHISILALAMALVISLTGTAFAWPAEDPVAPLTLDGGTAEQRALIDWALDLYDEAELPLPGLDVQFFADPADCFGRLGSATPVGARTEIRLCTEDAGPVQEWLVLHELAHAWDQHFSDADRRAAFLEQRGLAGWRTGEWHERGAEQAAEIMVWGLMDRPVVPMRFDQNSCEELRVGYETLIGRPPPHGFEDLC